MSSNLPGSTSPCSCLVVGNRDWDSTEAQTSSRSSHQPQSQLSKAVSADKGQQSVPVRLLSTPSKGLGCSQQLPAGLSRVHSAFMAFPRPGGQPGFSGQPDAADEAADMLAIAERLRRTLGLSLSTESLEYDTDSTPVDDSLPAITVQRRLFGLGSAQKENGTPAQTGSSGVVMEASEQGFLPRGKLGGAASPLREAASIDICSELPNQRAARWVDGLCYDDITEGGPRLSFSSSTHSQYPGDNENSSPNHAYSGFVAAAEGTTASSAAAAAAGRFETRIQSLEKLARECAREKVQNLC